MTLDLAQAKFERQPEDPAKGYITETRAQDAMAVVYSDMALVDNTKVDQTTLISPGTGLTGGGDLSASRTLGIADGGVGSDQIAASAVVTTKIGAKAVTGEKIDDLTIGSAQIALEAITDEKIASSGIMPSKVVGTAVVTGDSRLSDARTPTAHAASHGTGQSDAITIAPAQVTGTAVVNTIVDAKGDLIAASAADTPARLAVGVAGTNPILTPDTSAASGLAWKSHAGADVAKASTVGNLLTANVATGTDTLGATAGFLVAGATIESSTTVALVGPRSLKVTVTDAYVIVYTPGSGVGGSPVTPGDTYTALVAAQSTVSRAALARIYWYTADGIPISQVSSGSIATSATAWTLYTVTGVAPATAAYAATIWEPGGNVVGDVHYLDCWGFHVGAGGLWQPPGVPIPNLGIRANPADATQVQVWNPGNSTWITV